MSQALALRTHRAGLVTIESSVGDGATDSPRSAACAEEFRAQARPQPSFTARLPDLPGERREAGALADVPEGSRELRQARQLRPQRPRISEFEPANVFGTKPATIRIPGRHFTAGTI